jgi:hypothetical protein
MPEANLEQGSEQHVPVIYATHLGVNVGADDILLEFWEHRIGHSVPVRPAEEIVKQETPVARVVVPFQIARWLRDYLDKAIPTAEARRKAGE